MDISKIFKSKTRKSLFRLYFTNPDAQYYLRELERMLNIPVSMIRKELLQLEKDGIFLSRQKGNSLFFYLDKSYPLFEEFRSIVSKTIGIKALLTERLKNLKGIESAFIYGSFAKDEAKAQSDIDLFIIGNIDERALLRKMRELEAILKREINYTFCSKREFFQKRIKKDYFIMNLMENPKIFLIGGKDGL